MFHLDIIFHQIFWTFFSFIIFYLVFDFLFLSLIQKIFKARLTEESVLCNLIEKNLADKRFYKEENIVLKKARKDSIDNYVIKRLAKDEKHWAESLLRLNLETKAVEVGGDCLDLKIDPQMIKKIVQTALRRYIND